MNKMNWMSIFWNMNEGKKGYSFDSALNVFKLFLDTMIWQCIVTVFYLNYTVIQNLV